MELALHRDQLDGQGGAIQLHFHVQRYALRDAKDGNGRVGLPLLKQRRRLRASTAVRPFWFAAECGEAIVYRMWMICLLRQALLREKKFGSG